MGTRWMAQIRRPGWCKATTVFYMARLNLAAQRTRRGDNDVGTVFKITTNGTLTTLYSFTAVPDGANPAAGLVQGSDGSFYGTTYNGGTVYDPLYRTVFKISPNGEPSAVPMGFAFLGYGTVFKITPNGVLTTLYSFTGTDGANPAAGLVEGSDGYFYGTTAGGGTNVYGYGTVFRISTNGALTTLYSFTGGNDGAEPFAGLVQGSDGSFYGTTEYSDQRGAGTVFRLTIVPEFQAVTLTNNTLNLTWSTETGARYQLQYNSDLSSSNWINLGSPVTATGATLSTTDSLTNGPATLLPPGPLAVNAHETKIGENLRTLHSFGSNLTTGMIPGWPLTSDL